MSIPNLKIVAAGKSLTAREKEVAKCMAEGMSNKELSKALGISLHTTKEHCKVIFAKLGVDSRLKVALWAIKNLKECQP